MRKLNNKVRADRGKFRKKEIRPTASDLAALDILGEKLQMAEAQVWRTALARLVDFEGVRDQVAKKATLLERRAVSSVG